MAEKQTMWLVGQYRSGEPPETIWDFQGVFSTAERAVAACRSPLYFLVPITVDEETPDETVAWERVVYPHDEAG